MQSVKHQAMVSVKPVQSWANRWKFLVLLLLLNTVLEAHPMPGTLVELSVQESSIRGEARIPLQELANAVGDKLVQDPGDLFFTSYFTTHIRAVTGSSPWTTRIDSISISSNHDAIVGDYQEWLVYFQMTPPALQDLRSFTLAYDAVIHQVVTHRAMVMLKQDWRNGILHDNPQSLGTIQLDIPSGRVMPLQVNLQGGSRWTGIRSMVHLGMDHIREGTDHLLFLIVLLLPAMLVVNQGRWTKFAGWRYSAKHLLKIVTAFTAGHSCTLLMGAMGWVHFPAQPIELLIAASILVSALHAIRPLFAGKETVLAAGFGLVHGLAFASVIANMGVGAGDLALSILGFNAGIELMQLFIIMLVVPWLILLSKTRWYMPVRWVGATGAGWAAVAWIIERTTNRQNAVTVWIEKASTHGTTILAILACVAAVVAIADNWFRRRAVEQDATSRLQMKL